MPSGDLAVCYCTLSSTWLKTNMLPLIHLAQTAASFSLPQNFDFSHLLPPEPVAFPRKVLDQRFAVLLLRSTYDAVDALDFIAMVGPGTSAVSGMTLLAHKPSSSYL